MCFDMCMRAIHEVIETMDGLDYDSDTVEDPTAEADSIRQELIEIQKRMALLKGAHKDNKIPCALCATYDHHNHEKTAMRSLEDVDKGYDERQPKRYKNRIKETIK